MEILGYKALDMDPGNLVGCIGVLNDEVQSKDAHSSKSKGNLIWQFMIIGNLLKFRHGKSS